MRKPPIVKVSKDFHIADVVLNGRRIMLNLPVTALAILDGCSIRPTKAEQIAFAEAYIKMQSRILQLEQQAYKLKAKT